MDIYTQDFLQGFSSWGFKGLCFEMAGISLSSLPLFVGQRPSACSVGTHGWDMVVHGAHSASSSNTTTPLLAAYPCLMPWRPFMLIVYHPLPLLSCLSVAGLPLQQQLWSNARIFRVTISFRRPPMIIIIINIRVSGSVYHVLGCLLFLYLGRSGLPPFLLISQFIGLVGETGVLCHSLFTCAYV